MTLGGYFDVLRRWWLALLLLPVLAGVGGYAYASGLPTVYQARTSVLVGPIATDDFDDLRMAALLVRTYGDLVRSELILQRAIDEVPLVQTPDELRERTRTSWDVNTRILDITVQQPDPGLAAATADSLAAGLVAVTSADPQSPGRVSIVNRAVLPTRPIQPQPIVTALLLAAGAAVAVGLAALVWEYRTGRVRGESELDWLSDAPNLGSVPVGDPPPASPLEAALGRSNVAPGYRRLAGLLFGEHPGSVSSVMVVSADEPLPDVALDLAQAAADDGRKVTVIDLIGDGALASRAGALGDGGRADGRIAIGTADMDADASLPPGTTIVSAVGTDTAALSVWATRCDASIVVAMGGRTKRERMRQLSRDMDILGSRVFGTLLAQSARRRRVRPARRRGVSAPDPTRA